jgi:hypothetical protein
VFLPHPTPTYHTAASIFFMVALYTIVHALRTLLSGEDRLVGLMKCRRFNGYQDEIKEIAILRKVTELPSRGLPVAQSL